MVPHLASAACSVVLFALDGCALDFATLSASHLTGLLNLKSREDVNISRQATSFVRISCKTWQVKRHILSRDTRTAAESLFCVKIKEDLLKHERQEKSHMWSIMQALFQAGLRPNWSRSSVMWRHNGTTFFFRPGELRAGLHQQEIINIAKRKCGLLAKPTGKDQATQTVVNDDNHHAQDNFVTSLQQDLALQKQRTASKTVECCMLRRRLKASTELLQQQPPPARRVCAHTQTDNPAGSSGSSESGARSSATDCSAQTEPVPPFVEEVEQLELPGLAPISIPKSARSALGVLQKWFLEKMNKASAKFDDEVKVLKSRYDEDVMSLNKGFEAKILEMHAKANSLSLELTRTTASMTTHGKKLRKQ